MTESIASPTPSSMPGAVMAQSAPAALSVRQVAKTFGTRGALTHALNGITFDIDKGEFVAIMGPSGSGKTTLLNCVSTIDRPTSGQILVDGRDITSLPKRALTTFRRDELGFIFQDFNLLDTLTARENIALALTIKHVPSAEVAARTQDIASVLGVAAVLDKYPGQMSGGQKQRVAAARAIVGNPALILADEPTGALDSHSASVLLDTLSMMNRQMRATIMMVTHDSFAASFASRVLFIKDGALFNEVRRGDAGREEFFARIIEVVTFLGGGVGDDA